MVMMSKGTFMKDEEFKNATGLGVVAFRWTKHTVHVINMQSINIVHFLNVFSYATGHIEGKTSAWLEFTLKSQPKL